MAASVQGKSSIYIFIFIYVCVCVCVCVDVCFVYMCKYEWVSVGLLVSAHSVKYLKIASKLTANQCWNMQVNTCINTKLSH